MISVISATMSPYLHHEYALLNLGRLDEAENMYLHALQGYEKLLRPFPLSLTFD